MEPRIQLLPPKKLVGKSLQMTQVNHKTFELWNTFMKNKKYILNSINNERYSMQVYDGLYDFNPTTLFTKWAAIEVSDYNKIPEGMKTYELQGGLYAVFVLKGSVPEFIQLSRYIFGEWLPNSDYELDQREHFELLSKKYKRNDPNSEEEVWIPIKLKTY